MSDKAGSGCLSTIIFFAVLSFISKYIPLQYVFGGGLLIWLIYLYVNRDEIRAKREALNREKTVAAEGARKLAEAEEQRRFAHRDADFQEVPYIYGCVGHPNATLAIRYGIANQKKEVKEYWYSGKGGVQERNPDRDKIYYKPAETIKLRKINRIETNHYLAELTEFGNRRVRVVIERGTEMVKTFYPLDNAWFERHKDLETTLKNNKTFTLKELAMLHVQKTVKGA